MFKISGTMFFCHQPSSILLLDGSVSLNSEQLDKKKKTCPKTMGGCKQLQCEELDFLPRCTKSDRAVTVKGEGDEVDTGPMTVVNSQLI